MTEAIVIERVIAAPPEEVWPYVSDGGLWARWQGESCVIDPVPGGEFRMRMPDGATASGTVVEVVEGSRIVFTWGWTGAPFSIEPGSTTVEISLAPVEGGMTRITLTHDGLPPAESVPHRDGWEGCLEALASLFG